MHEDEQVVGCHLVASHLLRCAGGVTGKRFAHLKEIVTGFPKLRATATPFRVGFTSSKGMQEISRSLYTVQPSPWR